MSKPIAAPTAKTPKPIATSRNFSLLGRGFSAVFATAIPLPVRGMRRLRCLPKLHRPVL